LPKPRYTRAKKRPLAKARDLFQVIPVKATKLGNAENELVFIALVSDFT